MSEQNEFFTEKDAYELLSECPQEYLPSVLNQLGYPKGTEKYPVDILEKVLEVYKSMGIAVEKQKAISSSSGAAEDTQLAVQSVTAIASELLEEQGISFPVDVVMILATAAVEEGVQLARNLQTLKRAALMKELQTGSAELTEELLATLTGGSDIINEVFSAENMAVMIDSVVPQANKPNLAAFMGRLNEQKQAREQLREVKLQGRPALPPVNVKAFLAGRS